MHICTMVRGLVAAAGLALTIPLAAAPANAAQNVSFTVNATTHIKNVNQTVAIPAGTLTGKISNYNGKLTQGSLSLPNATKRLSHSTIPLADVTVAFIQAAPVTGTVDFNNGTADAKATFKVKVASIRPVVLPWLNLVSGSCTTKTASTVSIAGPINAGGTSTFNSGYQLAAFDNCGNKFATAAVTAALSGAGNTMSVSLS